jgi:hypothetical protein
MVRFDLAFSIFSDVQRATTGDAEGSFNSHNGLKG